jgi:hypothetical protein
MRLVSCLIFTIFPLILVACDRAPKRSAPLVTTATRTSPPAPPAPAPATRPSISRLTIDGVAVEFPRARLVIQHRDPELHLLLFSDDPPDALAASYSGNRYFFRLRLDIDDPEQLQTVEFRSVQSSVEWVDSPDGIFLDGDRQTLQPREWRLTFAKNGEFYAMRVDGLFQHYQNRRDEADAKPVRVQGVLVAEVEARNKGRRDDPATRPSGGR